MASSFVLYYRAEAEADRNGHRVPLPKERMAVGIDYEISLKEICFHHRFLNKRVPADPGYPVMSVSFSLGSDPGTVTLETLSNSGLYLPHESLNQFEVVHLWRQKRFNDTRLTVEVDGDTDAFVLSLPWMKHWPGLYIFEGFFRYLFNPRDEADFDWKGVPSVKDKVTVGGFVYVRLRTGRWWWDADSRRRELRSEALPDALAAGSTSTVYVRSPDVTHPLTGDNTLAVIHPPVDEDQRATSRYRRLELPRLAFYQLKARNIDRFEVRLETSRGASLALAGGRPGTFMSFLVRPRSADADAAGEGFSVRVTSQGQPSHRFEVRFSRPLPLMTDRDHQVALESFSLPNAFAYQLRTVAERTLTLGYYNTAAAAGKEFEVVLPVYYRRATDIANAFAFATNGLVVAEIKMGCLTLPVANPRLALQLHGPEKTLAFLGASADAPDTQTDGPGRLRVTGVLGRSIAFAIPIDLHSTKPTLIKVECAQVEASSFNGEPLPLLRAVSTDREAGTERLAYDFHHLEFKALTLRRLDSLRFSLTDEDGRPVDFPPLEDDVGVYMALRFRSRSPGDETKESD